MEKYHWTDHIRDNTFVRNSIVLLLTLFIFIGMTLMYLKGQLELTYYRNAIDIAIGIVIGGFLIKSLEKKQL